MKWVASWFSFTWVCIVAEPATWPAVHADRHGDLPAVNWFGAYFKLEAKQHYNGFGKERILRR
jgi:hypothetical protein